MANSDASNYTLRYNEISGVLEAAVAGTWIPVAITSGGVSSINTLTGAVTLAAGSNITLTPSGNTITIASTGGGSSVTPSVQATVTGNSFVTSGTYVTTGLTHTFALSNSTHKVRISTSGETYSDSGNFVQITIFVDGVDVVNNQGCIFFDNTFATGTTENLGVPGAASFLYSPGDTSSHTYTIMILSSSGGRVGYAISGTGIMILEEVI